MSRLLKLVLFVVLAVLVLAPSVASAAALPSAAAGYGGSSHPGYGYCSYQVRWGDTLSHIAARYDTSAWYLQSINGLPNPNCIKAGQWLRVPCGGCPDWGCNKPQPKPCSSWSCSHYQPPCWGNSCYKHDHHK